jgi:CheY-like chemotaxis protein
MSSDQINPTVPIIAMTAHAMTGDKARCFEAGMNDYVSKPIDPQLLVQTIEKYISPSKENRLTDDQ